MKTGSSFQRADPNPASRCCGRVSVLVGAAAGLSFLLGIGAALDVIDWTTAVDGGSALAAAGGITAFLAEC